ncbi:MAG: molybdopterin molybdotransferase MoeA [Vicingus serpentipes]|nr:molybdopterin molybdotransferase MoeA [Vicingus serpentipes]
MISVQEAKNKVIENTNLSRIISVNASEALNYYLAEDVVAPVSIPLFNQSAMDGYAFNFEDIEQPLAVVEEVPAGDTREVSVVKGEAVRIFTGSRVPDTCNTVVMQELTEIVNGKLLVKDEGLKLGGNIRLKGNQIQEGSIALKKGTKINAGGVGFLSALGLTQVKVHEQPKVIIIATGSELIKPGNELLDGQIYESNTFMLEAALKDMGIQPAIVVVKDDKAETERVISEGLRNNDLVLLSGGISVGDYDFVEGALEKNGVKPIFYKIKQKPGKPLYFGKTDKVTVFALPGNPAAALSCFYEYVSIAIKLMLGSLQPELSKLTLPIDRTYNKKAGRANFLKGLTDFKTVTPLEGQSSDALQSFSLANCLIFTSEETATIKEGELVEVHLLP